MDNAKWERALMDLSRETLLVLEIIRLEGQTKVFYILSAI